MPLALLRNLLSWVVLGFALFLSGHSALYSNTEEGLLRWLVLGTLFGGAGIFCLAVLENQLDRRLAPIFFGCVAMVLAQAVSFLAAGVFAPIDANRLVETIAQQSLVVLWIGFGLTLDWRSPGTFWVAVLSGLAVMIANLVDWGMKGTPIPFEGFSTGKNGLAAAACVGILLASAPIRSNPGYVILFASRSLGLLSALALFASGGRASFIFLLIFLGAKWTFPILKRTPIGPVFTTIGLVAVLATIPFVYINLEHMPGFTRIDDLLSSMTHSAYSGRETLWPEVIDGISEHPIVGNGTSVSWRFERRAYGLVQELSAHNLYLAILFQSGLIGLLGFICLIASVLSCLWAFPNSNRISFSFGVLLAALSREVWEVSLTQNTLQVGLGVWILITFGLSMKDRDAEDDMSD